MSILRTLLAASAVAALLATAATAQDKTQTPPNDNVEALLRARGEAYHRAPDAAQDPAEVKVTSALNAEITAQNDLAQSQEDADRRAFEAAQAQYQADVAQAEIERARFEADVRASEEARLAYEAGLADWRATVAACEAGDRVRCAAGSKPTL